MAIVSILVSLGGFAAGFLLGFPLSYLAGPFIGFAAGAGGNSFFSGKRRTCGFVPYVHSAAPDRYRYTGSESH